MVKAFYRFIIWLLSCVMSLIFGICICGEILERKGESNKTKTITKETKETENEAETDNIIGFKY